MERSLEGPFSVYIDRLLFLCLILSPRKDLSVSYYPATLKVPHNTLSRSQHTIHWLSNYQQANTLSIGYYHPITVRDQAIEVVAPLVVIVVVVGVDSEVVVVVVVVVVVGGGGGVVVGVVVVVVVVVVGRRGCHPEI